MSSLDNERQRYLVFSLGHEQYSVELSKVREVIAVPEITPVPHSPPHFLGMMNLRGQVISVVDLRLKLKGKAEKTAETAIVIVDLGDKSIGTVVSSVDYVLTLEKGELADCPPLDGGAAKADYINGVVKKDKQLILLLEIGKVLGPEDCAPLAVDQPAPVAALLKSA